MLGNTAIPFLLQSAQSMECFTLPTNVVERRFILSDHVSDGGVSYHKFAVIKTVRCLVCFSITTHPPKRGILKTVMAPLHTEPIVLLSPAGATTIGATKL